LEDKFSIGFIINLGEYLEGSFLNTSAFVIVVVLMHTLPDLSIIPVLEEYLFHDGADDETGGGVEVAVEEQYLIVCLLFNLLR
jgi:hypothetical protein